MESRLHCPSRTFNRLLYFPSAPIFFSSEDSFANAYIMAAHERKVSRQDQIVESLALGCAAFHPLCAVITMGISIKQLLSFLSQLISDLLSERGSLSLISASSEIILKIPMHSIFFKTYVVLAFSSLVTATQDVYTYYNVEPGWSLGHVNDWVPSGNYRIYSCSSKASQVKNLLDSFYLWIQNAMLSTDTPAYRAFFRGAAPDPIIKVLEAIAAGSNITTVLFGGGFDPPTLVCVNEADPGIRTFWNKCQDEKLITIRPLGSSLFLLCPHFFDLAPAASPQHCKVVNHASTRLIDDKEWIIGSQYGFFVQAFAAMYIPETLGKKPLDAVPLEVNDCLALPPDQAVLNPSSYSYFTSSELKPFLESGFLIPHRMRRGGYANAGTYVVPDIRAGCTKFPKHVPIQRDRELLAVDGGTDEGGSNGTNLVAYKCLSSGGTNSSSCVR